MTTPPITLAQWRAMSDAEKTATLAAGAAFSPEAYPIVLAERGGECVRVLQWCPRSQRLSALT